jgi:hypothetical protein
MDSSEVRCNGAIRLLDQRQCSFQLSESEKKTLPGATCKTMMKLEKERTAVEVEKTLNCIDYINNKQLFIIWE